MTKVHVLSGGASSEREVSLRSGAAVARALEIAGFAVQNLDPSHATIDEIIGCDVVFPVLHGAGGEDGEIQTALEARNSHFVGSDSIASKLCFDKSEYKRVMQTKGLPMPESALVHDWDFHDHPLAKAPFVLKPSNGGSSVDTFIVRDITSVPWETMLTALKERYGEMLLEQLIEGSELTVGILDGRPLPVIEIIPPSDGEFDYENKYNGKTQELCPPKHISQDIQRAAQELALEAHQLAGCRDFSRTDIMVDAAAKMFVLETNTIPGMTDQSLFPKMAATAGLPMPELCRQLIEMALSR